MTAAWVGLAPPKSSPSLLHLPSETAASGPKLGARFPRGFRLGLFREAPWQGAVGRRRERLSEISFPVPSCGIDTGRPCPATEGGLLSEFQQPMALAPQALGGKDPPPPPPTLPLPRCCKALVTAPQFYIHFSKHSFVITFPSDHPVGVRCSHPHPDMIQ